ncbi:MAG: NADH-quinone oxidoreductase subunit C [Candidatus Accumulibacter sp.]|jgi:Ni,Fe-hydrogenase III large subunit/Ni,Fe-hydrogenase III component G|nr:NADH-quinone oxidoreductase subunit C [Accumulibacter sp.]
MRFLNQAIDFEPLPGHAVTTCAARVGRGEWLAFCSAVKEAKRRLVALWGSDERGQGAGDGAGFALHAAFDLPEGLVCLTLPLAAENPSFPDLAPIFPAANRMQRAVMDTIGATPEGDGDRRPWLRHANWPVDYRPLRGDAEDTRFETQNEDYPFVRVEGEGVHEIAVGPIHAGIIEPGHFRFSVTGESVLRLEQRLGWKHKGIERRFHGMSLTDGARLAGRVSGDSTVAYAWAYCQAAEAIGAVTPPARALYLRALLLERERVINHLGDLGYLGNDVALPFGLMQFMRLKEDWVRLNARLFGHRFTMDSVVPGGVSVDLDDDGSRAILAQGDALESELCTLKGIYDEHAGLQDRFLTTGRITPELAETLGVIGLAGRASGQSWDLRCNHSCAPYDRLQPRIHVDHNGDVAARALVRFAEINESLGLLRAILRDMPPGETSCEMHSEANKRGFGWIEGWRGDILAALETGGDGKIRRCHCHDPSWQNWPALEHAVIDNIVPDFPLINKSFNLSYAGPDL